MSPSIESAAAWPRSPSAWRWVAGGLAVAFGLATLAEGGQVLFGGPAARAEAGRVVPFVLAFNFGAAFFYFATGAATLARQSWAVWLARALAGATALVFLAFGVHVLQGGAFETRTGVAMTNILATEVGEFCSGSSCGGTSAPNYAFRVDQGLGDAMMYWRSVY